MASLRQRKQANSGRETIQATKADTRPPAQPPREGDSNYGEISDVDDDSSTMPQEYKSDIMNYFDIIQIYVKPAVEITAVVIVAYLLYVHFSSPDKTERALLDVLNKNCGSSPSGARTCIERLLLSKSSGKVPEDDSMTKPVTPDCSHLDNEYRNLKLQVEGLQEWTKQFRSVFEDPTHMSEPLMSLKVHHRNFVTKSSAGKENDLADLKQVETDVKRLTESVEGIKKTLKESNTILAEIGTTLGETRTSLTDTNTNLAQLQDRINQHDERQKDMTENAIPAMETTIGEAQRKAEEAMRATETNRDELKVHIKKASSEYEVFLKDREATDKKMKEFTEKHDVIVRKLDGEELDGAMTKAELSQLKGKSTFHDIALYLALLSIIGFIIVVMYVRQTLSSASAPAAAPSAFYNNTQRGFRREEVYELSWTAPMENSLCVVTFHTETELKHADQTRSMFESAQQPCPIIHTRVIRCHADITQLPGSRVFLVFVDFNERNVILEDPSKGLGDLRVTTVRSLWKFGADVAVIYCGDRGSANLSSGLFNQDLGSIHRQKELTQLKRDERILSINTDFNDTQKQHCRNYINRLLHIAR